MDDADSHSPPEQLAEAIRLQDADALRRALSLKADRADWGGASEFTPLTWCALGIWTEGAKILLEAGFDPDEKDDYGIPALLFAISLGDFKTAKALLDAGADLDALDARGNDPMAIAAKRANGAECVAMLLAKRPDWPQRTNAAGRCALMTAAQSDHAATIGLLIDAGFDPNFVGPKGERPLGVAAQTGSMAALAELLARGAHPDGVAAQAPGFTPLGDAATFGRIECVQALLDAGADPLLAGADGCSPAAIASASKQLGARRILDLIHARIALDEAAELRAQVKPAPWRSDRSLRGL